MPRSIRKTLIAMAVILAFSACSGSADKAGGRGLQEVTVLEIAQPNDVAPPQVQAYAAEVDKQSHGSLQLHFNDVWRQGRGRFREAHPRRRDGAVPCWAPGSACGRST